VDGINVMDVPAHGTFASFGERVIPVLAQRGLVPSERRPGTIRSQLFGTDRLDRRHPARRLAPLRALAR
jgi:hypothetical protein